MTLTLKTIRCFLLVHLLMSTKASQQRRRHVAADGSIREYNPTTKKWVFIEPIEQTTTTDILAIEGRRFEYDFAQGEFHINQIPMYIIPPDSVRDSTNQKDGDTGRTVWDAAVVIAKYMEKNHHAMQGKRVLELGAGTGLAGLAAAALGALVDISDLGYCIPSIATNIQHTNLTQSNRTTGMATARTLDWTTATFDADHDTYDIVLGADIVWLEHLVGPLVSVMEQLLSINAGLKILLSHQTRSAATDEVFFGLLSKRFTIASIEKPEGYKDTRVNLFELTGKSVGGNISFAMLDNAMSGMTSEGDALSNRMFIQRLTNDASFRLRFSQALNTMMQRTGGTAVFWECARFTPATMNQPWECRVERAKALEGRATPDGMAFETHFKNTDHGTSIAFDNLGNDARLVSPRRKHNDTTFDTRYSHLAAFLDKAEDDELDSLWQTVGTEATTKMDAQESFWLSTDGRGVNWLHIRLDNEFGKYIKLYTK